MALEITPKFPSVSLGLSIFQILNFIASGTRALSPNEVYHSSFKWFQLKKILINPQQKTGKFL